MTQQFILVVYDISNDKRRTKLHNVLLDYGTPVQYSVFECHLDPKNLSKMKKAVTRVIRKRKDNVRFYALCADCEKRIESSRPHEVNMSEPKDTMVV
ncbi:MAG: CRISPR-associated endonuclease Cas2 [Anaerolineales bacterium]|nr:CRISPR-associated endonuclease Cas2 [Anaerolineales bacterium]